MSKKQITKQMFANSIKLTGSDRERALKEFDSCKNESEKEKLLRKSGFFQTKNITTK